MPSKKVPPFCVHTQEARKQVPSTKSKQCQLTRSRGTCPICEGAGELTTEQEKRLKWLLDLATWARELQKRVEAEEANHGLTPEDLQFLGDLGIGLGEEE